MAITDDSPTQSHRESDWQAILHQALVDQSERMISIRRELHQHPELSGNERETSLLLYQLLGDAGFAVQLGPEGCGLIADWPADEPVENGRFAIRADLDALRIEDCKDVDYRSQVPGVMHACGHDAHSAILIGTLMALKQVQTSETLKFPCAFRGIFQPAEETSSGARQMIGNEALEDVRAIIALHVDPSRDVGKVGIRSGVLTSNCDDFQIMVYGRGGHAARPHETHDPVAASAQLINALYNYIPRVTNSQDAIVLTICQIDAGDSANVIPEVVRLRGTLRTLDAEIRQKTLDHISRIARGIAEATETRIEVRYGLTCPSVINDESVTNLLRNCAQEIVGKDGIDEIELASMGSEDFSLYLQQIPGVMVRLGCRGESVGGSSLHSPDFDIDERALHIGAELMSLSAIRWWEQFTSLT